MSPWMVTVASVAAGWMMIWSALNTLHFVVRPLRLRRKWLREHKGVGKGDPE